MGRPKLPKAIFLLVIALGLLASLLPTAAWLLTLLGIGLLSFLLMLVLWALKRINPAPVPEHAVRQLLADSTASDEEWVFAQFRPGVSLSQAAVNISRPITEDERLRSFMTKLQFVAHAAPRVALFYAADKGFVCGRRVVIAAMCDQYGRWTLDTWWSLVGALRKHGYDVHSLDGPQVVDTRRLFRDI